MIEEFFDDGVRLLELRSTPRASKTMTKLDYLIAIMKGIDNVRQRNASIDVGLIVSIDRRHNVDDIADTCSMTVQLGLCIHLRE